MTHAAASFASRSLLAFVALLGSASLGACSSDEGGISSSEFASRFCALYKPCCEKAGFPATNQETCHFFYGAAPVSDKAAAEQCLKDYEQLAQGPDFCDLTNAETPASCKKAFPQNSNSGGSKKPGASCESSSECAGEATCDKPFSTGGTQAGVCAEFVLVAEGAACIGNQNGNSRSWSGDAISNQIPLCDFKAGFNCDGSVCVKRGQVGEACAGSSSCVDGAHCKSSVCEQDLATGSPCPDFSDECNDAAYCADSTQLCEPRIADGESCQVNDECLSDYCNAGTCKFNPGLGGLVLGLVCG